MYSERYFQCNVHRYVLCILLVTADVNEAANTGSPITDTTCGSRGASPSPTRGTSFSSTPKTTHRTMSVSPSVGSTRRTTNYAAGAREHFLDYSCS